MPFSPGTQYCDLWTQRPNAVELDWLSLTSLSCPTCLRQPSSVDEMKDSQIIYIDAVMQDTYIFASESAWIPSCAADHWAIGCPDQEKCLEAFCWYIEGVTSPLTTTKSGGRLADVFASCLEFSARKHLDLDKPAGESQACASLSRNVTIMTVVEIAFKKLSQGLPCWNAQEDGADTRWAEESNEEFAAKFFCGSPFVTFALFRSFILLILWHIADVCT